ncbi:putative transcriptional regulatory [Hyphodiscus hymeniophilus]|uniref:Transcriptional regulatory n=1 Tax=Hyphodiscus hymeniophilus TaxID=353542 RepID=A0A9P7AUJ2_9HELO|nr:putative transcriptional regulatory [Hyphodiscus hymeniophilus]
MSSGQAPVNFYARSATSYETPANETGTAASMHTDPPNLAEYMMNGSQHTQNHSILSPSQPHLDVVGNPQFADFAFRYPDNGLPAGDSKIENAADPYNLSGHVASSDHRGSMTSMAPIPRASFSGSATIGHGNASLSGSEEASPISNRTGGMDGGYNDDFGLSSGGALDGSDLGSRTKEEKNGPTPPWSELKTKAGKERKRLPLACIACRRKKIRCSGEKPACKHCLRSRIPCVYKVTTRKAAPRTDYMAMLDKRLKRMEERIIKIVPKEEQDNTVSVTRAAVKPAIPGTVPVRHSTSKKRAAEEAFGAELDNWSKSVSKSHLEDGSIPSSLMIQEAAESKLLSEGAEALPPKDIQEHLSEVFFENIYGQTYHVLHKPSFMRKLKAGTVPPVLILAVCAVSARFSTHPKLNTTPAFLRGEDWAAEARDIVTKRYDWPNITILTCLLILGLHEFGTCQGGRSWALGGQAIRMAYALQLHKDLDYDPSKRNDKVALSFIDREIRRRTMWACFLMDRFNSSGTDRPTFVKEMDMKIPLPIKEKLFQMDMPGPTENLQGKVVHPVPSGNGELSHAKDNMGVAAYMVRSIALWGRIINYLNLGGREQDPFAVWHSESGFAALLKETDTFESSLPDSLKFSQENIRAHETESLATQFLFLHISIQQSSLFTNRFAVPGVPGGRGPEGAPKEFVKRAGAKSFEAANRISAILKDGEAHFITAPFTGYCAFLASTVHIFGIFSKNPQMESASKQNLAINVKYMSKMKRYWGMFHFMSENLKVIYRNCADASMRGSSGSNDASSKSVFQYGDWFDQYPHGVSQSDFEDPAAEIKKEKGEDAVLEQKSDYHTVEEFFHTLEPVPTQSGTPKSNKRKTKKAAATRQERSDPVNTNLHNIPLGQQIQNSAPAASHAYNQMSPTTPVNMYNQAPYYSNDVLLPPHQQGMLPQLDRQLVFGAYAGMDPPGLNSQNMLDGGNSWDLQMGGMTSGFGAESSSAWLLPFNIPAPDINDDIFSNLDVNGYGGMSINNNGNGMGGGN